MAEQTIRIVRMQQRHLPALCRLELQCFSQPWSLKSLQTQLSNPVSHFFVALCEEKVAGYLGMAHVMEEGFIHNIAVFEEHRRKGVASLLMRKVDDYAAGHGLRRVTLEVRVSNEPAIRLYERFGYECEGARPGFYQYPDEDAWIYTKVYADAARNRDGREEKESEYFGGGKLL